MKHSKNAIRLDFPKKVRNEFQTIAKRIITFAQSRLPEHKKLMSFGIDEVNGETQSYIFYMDGQANNELKFEFVNDLSWAELQHALPDLERFCQKYSLERSFTMAGGHDVPPHRHHYTPKSMWSITMFLGDSPGTIKFYEPTAPVKAGYQFENLSRDMNMWRCSEEIKSLPGDFYSINTWVWHGWVGSEPKLSAYGALFYIKDSTTQKDALASIERINSL